MMHIWLWELLKFAYFQVHIISAMETFQKLHMSSGLKNELELSDAYIKRSGTWVGIDEIIKLINMKWNWRYTQTYSFLICLGSNDALCCCMDSLCFQSVQEMIDTGEKHETWNTPGDLFIYFCVHLVFFFLYMCI